MHTSSYRTRFAIQICMGIGSFSLHSMHGCNMSIHAMVHIGHEGTEKNLCKDLHPPNFFTYMKCLIKPMLKHPW